MNWFLIALINPIAHAFVNHFDKYLLSKYVKGGTVGALILFSALFAVFALPVIYFINPGVLSGITLMQGVILMVNGAFLTLGIILYLYALDTDEASYVAPFMQFYPVFGFLLGFILLKEVLDVNQILAGILIVIGSVVLSYELNPGKKKFKLKLVALMIGACFFYSINAVIFKSIAVDEGFTTSLFWDMAGKFIFGVILFVSLKSYQTEFIGMIKNNGVKVVILNVINEIIGLVGEIATVFAVLLAPVAMVQSLTGLQPVFVLIIGIFLTLFFPKFAKESLSRNHLLQKIIGVVIVTVGVFLLDLN